MLEYSRFSFICPRVLTSFISISSAFFLLSSFILFSVLPQPILELNDELSNADFNSSGSLFQLSTVLTEKENFLMSVLAYGIFASVHEVKAVQEAYRRQDGDFMKCCGSGSRYFTESGL